MKLLLNVATHLKGVILYDDQEIVDRIFWDIQGQELRYVLPSIENLLQKHQLSMEKDIEKIVLCIGPGSFTGIRIAVSIVNTWKFLYPHIALASFTVGDLLSVLDTRESPFYFFQVFFADVFLFERTGVFLEKIEQGEFFASSFFTSGKGQLLPTCEQSYQSVSDMSALQFVQVKCLEQQSVHVPFLAEPFYGKGANITTPKVKS